MWAGCQACVWCFDTTTHTTGIHWLLVIFLNHTRDRTQDLPEAKLMLYNQATAVFLFFLSFWFFFSFSFILRQGFAKLSRMAMNCDLPALGSKVGGFQMYSATPNWPEILKGHCPRQVSPSSGKRFSSSVHYQPPFPLALLRPGPLLLW